MADQAVQRAHQEAEQAGYVLELLAGVEGQLTLLREIAEALRGSAASLAVSEKAQQPQLTTDFPFAGSHRWLIPRQPSGDLIKVEAAKAIEVLGDNPNRLGAYIVNAGTKVVDLFLVDGQRALGSKAAIARIRLPAGQAWDCRLGPNLLWSGSISAEAAEATELSVAEV